MTPTEIAAVVGPLAVLTAGVASAFITQAATVRSGRRAAAVSWHTSHVKDQYAAVTAFLADTVAADTNGATLNLKFLAPTEAIRDAALRIQALDKQLAKPAPKMSNPPAQALAKMREYADRERVDVEVHGQREWGTESRALLAKVEQLHQAQERAEDAGEPAPDVTALRDRLIDNGAGESWVRDLLCSAAERRLKAAECAKADDELRRARHAAAAEREELHAQLATLMQAWVSSPPG
ncbi:hypothetical protein AB0O22_31935 [Streptomyces sp. NPDC091204]|uniref:hypothetical protein n=1 Tax=Streptomyces sp. NPDC091204 TaxID=3155299 RepID=UPI00341AE5DB